MGMGERIGCRKIRANSIDGIALRACSHDGLLTHKEIGI